MPRWRASKERRQRDRETRKAKRQAVYLKANVANRQVNEPTRTNGVPAEVVPATNVDDGDYLQIDGYEFTEAELQENIKK